uniref:MULE domain-containing protein n=1 Tax=Panagrellus redivivus TaxID=6233 RepID=A0A7E4UM75_PANRE
MESQLATPESEPSDPEPHPDPLPFSSLPYNFKMRLLYLAPERELNTFRNLNLETYTLTSLFATFVEHLYVVQAIAGRQNAKQWLSISKGPMNFNIPIAQHLLAAKKTIFVKYAVIIDEYVCPKFEAVLPLIKGDYHCIYLFGTIKFDYMLQLVTQNIEKFYIDGTVQFDSKNVESFVKQFKEKLNGTKCKLKLEQDLAGHRQLMDAFATEFGCGYKTDIWFVRIQANTD